LLKYEALLKNNSKWCQQHASLPTIGYNCVNDLQDISAMYFAVGNQAMYRQAIVSGDAISPVVWMQAMGITDQILMELRSTMQRFSPGKYGEKSRLFLEYFKGPVPPLNLPHRYQEHLPHRDQQPPKRARQDEPPANQYNQSKKGKLEPDKAQTDQKASGFLNWVAHDAKKKFPAPCPVTYAAQGKSEEKICIRFITVGSFCGYGPTCNFHHPNTFQDVPQQAQLLLTKYVNNTKGLSFVPGKGPKST
jgi:hypothetical protein